MKCVILAGGKGTRISELSKDIPKPMIRVLGKPIIMRIIMHYYNFGIKDFIIAAGYKKNIIRKYFSKKIKDLNIRVIDTGLETMTGGRLKRLEKILQKETFLLTYGDGLSNVNISKLINFHKKNRKLLTMTAVRPLARFGFLKLKGNKVKYFREKSSLDEGWINGGFFVVEPKFLSFIKNDKTYLEKEPIEKAVKKNQICAFKHKRFWHCMDTLRDKENLERILVKKNYLQTF
jgi:glucose-1-phosphate cytidylyltransferase